MTEVEEFELLVVGGGKAGKTLAMDLAKAGVRVAMVEQGMIGGTCINVACIPTKTLVTSARALRTLRRAKDLGIVADGHPDLDLLRAHKNGVVDGMVAGNRKMFLDSGMDLVIGTARFIGPRTARIELADGGARVLRGQEVVIDTGTKPMLPPIPGLAEAAPLTSETMLELERIPERLIVLGGGYVGAEFAQMMSRFGSRVTLVEAADRLLAREDAEFSDAVAEIFVREGIHVRLASPCQGVCRNADGTVTATLPGGEEIVADDILVAVGRTPVTEGLGLEAAEVDLDEHGFIKVDARLRTTAEHVWAAGDVAGSPQFTHLSLDDYRVIKADLAGQDRTTTGRLVPYVVFLDPELARVGMIEEQARADGHQVKVSRLPVAAIPRARTLRETEGLWKIVVEGDTDQILGATLLGPESGEVITTIQTAMLTGLTFSVLQSMTITHPTMTEGLNVMPPPA
jgi:probable pyridine nucleotide-disulfide oxidoreductase